MRLRELAAAIGGTIIGNPDIEISGAAGIIEAGPGQITFISSPRYLRYLRETNASCVIVAEEDESASVAQVKVDNPYLAFAKALEQLYPRPSVPAGVSGGAVVSPAARIGDGVTVMPFAFVGDSAEIGEGTMIYPFAFIGDHARIGSRCVIHPNVTVREGVSVGDRVVIHAGSVIGSDGFGYVMEKGEHYKIPQVGGVVIEDDVEIGSNVSIDRATTGNTVVGRGTKVDNLVQIAHNVSIGTRCLIVSQVGISGSSTLGDYVTLAGQVGIADHVDIEGGTIITAQSGVPGNMRRGVYSGSPAIPHKEWLKAAVLFGKLPEMSRRIRELEERLHTIEKGNTQ